MNRTRQRRTRLRAKSASDCSGRSRADPGSRTAPGAIPIAAAGLPKPGLSSNTKRRFPNLGWRRIRFRVHVGRCRRCGHRVRGRHPRQTSNAVGSAASQLGPRAVALATQLNKGLGLS
jgi:hypothetical protein